MDIFGRNVTAIRYDGTQMVNAYVDRKPGDCIKEKDEAYQCLNNCQGKIVVARFDNRHVVSLKALTPFTFQVADWLEDKIRSLNDLQEMGKEAGFSVLEVGPSKILYLNQAPVSCYIPCGFSLDQNTWPVETRQTVIDLVQRCDEVYTLANVVPYFEILNDPALRTHLRNPMLYQLVARLIGPEGISELQELRNTDSKKN